MSEIIFDQDEAKFVNMVLRTADENDTDIEKSMELVHNTLGLNVEFVGGTDEFYDDPPEPSDLHDQMKGQRFEGDATDIEALQTLLTVYVFDVTRKGGGRALDLLDIIEGIHPKIREAYDEEGGYDD